jgi:hypothetical protein
MTGVGGGKNAFCGTLLCAPPGGGAKDVKLIPPLPAVAPWVVCAAGGKRGAGGMVQLALLLFLLSLSNFLSDEPPVL